MDIEKLKNLIENKMETLELMPNQILIVKSPDHKDARDLGDALRQLRFFNPIFWITPDIQLDTMDSTQEEVILQMADEIKKIRKAKEITI